MKCYLYDRSLLTIINSNEIYGNVRDPDYWLYSFHPAVRNYVQFAINEKRQIRYGLEIEYREKFSEYYYNLLKSTYDSIGKDNHLQSLARFNIINQGKVNDFEKAIQLAADRLNCAYILTNLGLISSEIGIYARTVDYYIRSIAVYEELNYRVGMAGDYGNIGVALQNG
jgi:predicted GNAT superfamily acetyltransferase